MKYSKKFHNELNELQEFLKCKIVEQILNLYIKETGNAMGKFSSWITERKNSEWLVFEKNIFDIPFYKTSWLDVFTKNSYEYDKQMFIIWLARLAEFCNSKLFKELKSDVDDFVTAYVAKTQKTDYITIVDHQTLKYGEVEFDWGHFNRWITHRDIERNKRK